MTIAGTGHRPDKLGGYNNEAFLKLVDIAELGILEYVYGKEQIKVISGMALGWDQALAQATINLGYHLTAAVPFKGQELAWQPKNQAYYNRILGLCDEVVYVSEPGFTAAKMQKRNEWMVDRCDILLAMWDGSDGGTANCIRYAENKNVKIKNLYNHYTLVTS